MTQTKDNADDILVPLSEYDPSNRWRIGSEERCTEPDGSKSYVYRINNELPDDEFKYPEMFFKIPYPSTGSASGDTDVIRLNRLVVQEVCAYMNWYSVVMSCCIDFVEKACEVLEDGKLDSDLEVFKNLSARLFGSLQHMSMEAINNVVE
jgi:hypothetical protein